MYREALSEIYRRYSPEEIKNVDSHLIKWSGREQELFEMLSQKHRIAINLPHRGDEQFHTVLEGLKNIYKNNIRPLEEMYKFDCFFSQCLENVDIEAKPMVLLLGSYSVGKTSFVKYLVGRDFPGIRIGPEPTTDRFVAVMHGTKDQIIPGNAVSIIYL